MTIQFNNGADFSKTAPHKVLINGQEKLIRVVTVQNGGVKIIGFLVLNEQANRAASGIMHCSFGLCGPDQNKVYEAT